MKTRTISIFTFGLSLIVVGVIWITSSPGYMSYDSLVQFETSLSQQYSDSHPAAMSLIWHLAQFVMPGPQSLLLIHMVLLLVGLLSWERNLSPSPWRILLPGLFLLPWLANFAGVLWKDVGMAFALLAASGILFRKERSWLGLAFAVPLLFYAAAVRHNAILAIVPLILLASRHLFPARPWYQVVILTGITSALLPLGTSILTYQVLKAEARHYETLMMGDELAKFAYLTSDYDILPTVAVEDIVSCSPLPILYERALCFIDRGYDPSGSIVVDIDPEEVRERWLSEIINHPLQYAQIKLESFLFFLRSPVQDPYFASYNSIMKNKLGLTLNNPQLSRLAASYILIGTETPVIKELFKPYIWLLLACALTGIALLQPGKVAQLRILALNGSSLGYFAGYLVGVPSADFRYVYWCVIATSVSMVILLCDRGHYRRPEARFNAESCW